MGDQPLFAVERTVERVPGRWPLSSPPPKAVAGRPGFTRASVPGYNRHQWIDGLRF